MIALRSPRLHLRLLQEDGAGDAELYAQLYTDPVVMAHVMPALSCEAAGRAFGVACGHNRASRPGHRTWRIDAIAGAAHGIAALRRSGDRAEIGVMLRQASWGQGIARESLATVLAHAFGPMDLALVHGERPDDAQARRVDRMFAPLGLLRAPSAAPGQARWELPRSRWKAPA